MTISETFFFDVEIGSLWIKIERQKNHNNIEKEININ